MSTPAHMIVATYDNQDPQLWGPYNTSAAAAETDRAYLEQHVFSRHTHYAGSIVRASAMPLSRPVATAIMPPPPLPNEGKPARASRRYRRREGFYCVRAGEYVWKIGHGYTARVRKNGPREWIGYVMQGDKIARTDKGVMCAAIFRNKDVAEIYCRDRAQEITYETYNMLGDRNADGSRKTFRMPITTPHYCDPSTESYHCM